MKKRILKKGIWSRTQQYVQDAESYIKESKKYIGGAAILFVTCIFAGFIFADYLTSLNSLITQLKESVGNLRGEALILEIFKSNTLSALFSIFLGIFLGIFSVINIALNGTLIGYVMHILWQESGATHFWKLLPHGIFELPALFISWGLGIKLGMFIFAKDPGKELKRRLIQSLKVFLFIVIPLLFIAAIIEGLLITFLV